MLTVSGLSMAEEMRVSNLVVSTLAHACGVAERRIGPRTRMQELDVDSLTLVAILARVEALRQVEFSGDETLALLEAHDVAGLIAAIEGLLERRRGA